MALVADIRAVSVPSTAEAGERVDVRVSIKNLLSEEVGIMVVGALENEITPWPQITFPTDQATFPPLGYHYFDGYFNMPYYPPGKVIKVHAYSYWYGRLPDEYWDSWHFDDEMVKSITIAAPPEVYAGTIIGIELEHDGIQEGLPVYDIPQGQTARIHVWGRNDMSTTQRLGIHWLVYDPDGILVQDYEDWSLLYYRQGTDHQFIGGRFNLAKPGTYTINIALSMNPSDPEIVDSYYGNLCTVAAAVPEPAFRGFGVREYQTV